MTDALWWQLLLVAAATHVGLELVVHLVVYPALASASTESPGTAQRGHTAHMRRMGFAVAPVYGLLGLAALGVVLLDPSWPAALGLLLVVATYAVTGLAAVPAHGSVVAEPDPAARAVLHRRLARADLARLVLALALLATAWLGAAAAT